jgi:hypothetical protein
MTTAASLATWNLQLADRPILERIRTPPLRQVSQWFEDDAGPWWGICWNTGLPWGNCRGSVPPRWQVLSVTHLPEPRKNAERIAAIKQTIPATEGPGLRETCVLTAHSLVAILATLRAQIAMFGGVSPNSLAPVRNAPKNRPSGSQGASLQGGYAPHSVSATATVKAFVVW